MLTSIETNFLWQLLMLRALLYVLCLVINNFIFIFACSLWSYKSEIKNFSRSYAWGFKGYIKMSRKVNNIPFMSLLNNPVNISKRFPEIE